VKTWTLEEKNLFRQRLKELYPQLQAAAVEEFLFEMQRFSFMVAMEGLSKIYREQIEARQITPRQLVSVAVEVRGATSADLASSGEWRGSFLEFAKRVREKKLSPGYEHFYEPEFEKKLRHYESLARKGMAAEIGNLEERTWYEIEADPEGVTEEWKKKIDRMDIWELKRLRQHAPKHHPLRFLPELQTYLNEKIEQKQAGQETSPHPGQP
jgi:hypothetical protein